MKLNKTQIGLIAGVVCVILLTILLLSMCNGSAPEAPAPTVQTTEAMETTVPATEAAVETTEAATEETIEETTEATEETTEPTTGGNTRPGGTGGPGIGGGNTGGNTSTEPSAPKAGSEESPYMEVVSRFPDEVNTVSIPANGTVHYHLNLLDESVARYGESLLVIEGENVSVIYNETTYEAVNGIVSVPLMQKKSAEEENTEEAAPVAEEETEETPEENPAEETQEEYEPVAVRIVNGGAEARTLTMKLYAPLGTLDNPEAMLRGENGALDFTAELEENDEDGYYFSFVAQRDGKLLLQRETAAESGAYDITVTAGEESGTLTSDGETASLPLEFKKGDQVLVHFLARAAEDGSRPAAKAKITGYADYYGSKTNPIEVEKDFTIEDMEADGQVLYYLVKNQKSMALNVNYPAYVVYNGNIYQAEAPEEGAEVPVISVKIGNGEEPALMAIGNGGEETASFAVTFTKPIGHTENKDTLNVRDEEASIDGINTAVIDAGDADVYWFTWTNTMDTGILTIKMPEQGNWKYTVTPNDTVFSDGDPAGSVISMVMDYEDVLDIQVATYDPADPDALPVGSVTFEATFQPHTLIAPEGDTWLSVDSGELIYCKQGLKYADGAIMTVVAVEADEDGNAKLDANGNVIVLTDRAYTIDYEGVIHTSKDGKVVVDGIETESTNADIFSFRNDGTEKTLYRISFSYPEGHMTNPIPLELGSYSITLKGDGNGIFYTYKINQPTYFRFEITEGAAWTYNITTSTSLETFASTKTSSSREEDVNPVVDVQVTQEDLDASQEGYVLVTINLGNPSTDIENSVDIIFTLSLFDEYPLGSLKNPEIIADGTSKVNLPADVESYYFSWTAAEDGWFDFQIPNSRIQWVYEITHGEKVYEGRANSQRTLQLRVVKDDVVLIKFAHRNASAYELNFDIKLIPMTVYQGNATPESFSGVSESVGAVDLTKTYTLHRNADGTYSLTQDGPAVYVDFTSDAFVNLKSTLETTELYREITAEGGSIVREGYNQILTDYLACAQVITVSETQTRTLYPLTEDLMYVLKNVGTQLGWYNTASGSYLFKDLQNVQQDSMWMFCCCSVQEIQTVAAEAETEPAQITEQENTLE